MRCRRCPCGCRRGLLEAARLRQAHPIQFRRRLQRLFDVGVFEWTRFIRLHCRPVTAWSRQFRGPAHATLSSRSRSSSGQVAIVGSRMRAVSANAGSSSGHRRTPRPRPRRAALKLSLRDAARDSGLAGFRLLLARWLARTLEVCLCMSCVKAGLAAALTCCRHWQVFRRCGR